MTNQVNKLGQPTWRKIMVQLLFDDRLIDQLPMNKYKLANQSFKKWSLAPVKIGQQHLYLYVEEKTGMPIFSDQLGQDQFSILYSNLVETLGFLTAKQKEWLLDEIDFTSVYYRYLQPLTNPFLPQYEKFIEQHQKEFIKAAQQDNDVARNVTLLKLTSKLLKEMNLYDKVLASFVQNVNFLRPQKTHRPKANAKYVIYQPNFDDPRYLQESVKDELTDDDQNIIRIRKNNQRMIDQFLKSEIGQDVENQKQGQKILEDYLNNFLVKQQGEVITTNLASFNLYMTTVDDHDGLIRYTLTDFYEFLSQAGILTLADVRTVNSEADNDFTVLDAQPLPGDKEEFHKLLSFQLHDPEFFEEAQELIKNGDLPASYQDILDDVRQKYANSNSTDKIKLSRISQYYHLHSELVGFQPKMTRDFVISGDQSISEMAELLIVMFGGTLYHLYNVENPVSKTTYELQTEDDGAMDLFMGSNSYNIVDAEQATVSLLNDDDELRVNYDFGDGWEFKLTIQNITAFDSLGTPRITDAVGYGIIEDIGGPTGLTEYYQEFKNGDVDPYFKELLDGHLVDLGIVDINRINTMVRAYLSNNI